MSLVSHSSDGVRNKVILAANWMAMIYAPTVLLRDASRSAMVLRFGGTDGKGSKASRSFRRASSDALTETSLAQMKKGPPCLAKD